METLAAETIQKSSHLRNRSLLTLRALEAAGVGSHGPEVHELCDAVCTFRR